jgi:hypothetical protein
MKHPSATPAVFTVVHQRTPLEKNTGMMHEVLSSHGLVTINHSPSCDLVAIHSSGVVVLFAAVP